MLVVFSASQRPLRFILTFTNNDGPECARQLLLHCSTCIYALVLTLVKEEQLFTCSIFMKSDPKKLIKKHERLTHSELFKVVSHVQRNDGDWIINTIMVDGCDVPFKFNRKRPYRSLRGARVNLTYYPVTETVVGFEFEVMKVVRIRIS